MTALAPTLQSFFTDRLVGQRDASPNTIAAYRVSLRLLLRYASQRTGKQPCALDLDDLDAPLIAAFLEHLERDRGNSPRTRNNRLAAIHSMFTYAALQHPEHAASITRVLAIPPKRTERNLVTFLTDEEVDALIDGSLRSCAMLGRLSPVSHSASRSLGNFSLAAASSSERPIDSRAHTSSGALISASGVRLIGRPTSLKPEPAPRGAVGQ
jgi:integrase